MPAQEIPAAQFKAKCLQLMEQVEATGEPITITKHGRPVAQLCPAPAARELSFGYMKGTVKTVGDIMAPLDVQWSALSGDEDHLYTSSPPKNRPRGSRRK